MLKRIDVADVQLGMFIHKLEGSWFKHPFWKSKFLLDDPETLENLRYSDVDGVIIDTSKGNDATPFLPSGIATHMNGAPAAARINARPAAAPPRFQRAAPAAAARQPSFDLRSTARLGMAREFGNAGRVADKGRKVVSRIFLESRLGKTIKSNQIEPVIEDIFSSVQRNPHAFNGLMRCKRDNEYVYRHALAVSALMISLGRQMKLPPEDIRIAGMAGLLMDVGVGHLPVDLAEWGGDYRRLDPALLNQHVTLGYNFLQLGGDIPDAVVQVCLCHHERLDGSGYPNHMRGDEIGLLSRMAAICDTYDALVSDGSDGVGVDPGTAIQVLSAQTTTLDPVILQHFIEAMGIHPIGSVVRLRSGRLALVVDQDPSDYARPQVRTFFSTHTGKFCQPEDIALSQCWGQDEIDGTVDPATYGIADFAKLRERIFSAASKANA